MTLLTHDESAIIAQCTPKGSGALALLRISGTNAISVASSISKLVSGKSLLDMPTHTIHFGFVIDTQGRHIDQVLFLLMHAPRTFTGQNTVEITCHNNPFIVAEIIQCAINASARMAQNGEFARRAVINDKIDLIQAEAINELIHANTTMALKQSLAQMEGSLSAWIVAMEEKLLTAMTLSEASFEFIDDEISFGNQIKEIIDQIKTDIKKICKTFDQQQQIRNGIRIVIIGSVNAGKSSLFNALLEKERAIVTDIPGTTRDTIEAGLYKDGNYWTLIDTAGIRKTDDSIEKQGIERSLKEASLADIIILVIDGSRDLDPEEESFYAHCIKNYKDSIILVRNKVDAAANKALPFAHCIDCSCATHYNIDAIDRAIAEKISALFEKSQAPFLLNERHHNLLLSLEQRLGALKTMLAEPIQYELLSTHIKDALVLVSELTGKSISAYLMDNIFKQFCVGK